MRRREFLSVLGNAAAAMPLAAWAQQRTLPVIGLLSAVQPHDVQRLAFQQGLREVGFVEGHNVTIEYRSADGQYARLEAFAADLVKLRVDVIAALFTPVPARVAKAATNSIPIARALATVREWKKRSEHLAHSRSVNRGGCGLPIATGAVS